MKLSNLPLIPLAGFALALVTFTSPADAALVAVNTRAGLGGTDSVDWGILGPEFTTPSNPFTILSNQGITATVSKPSVGNFERADEGGFGWTGNFSVGDKLLWTSLTPGPITIDLGASGYGGGVQIQNDFLGVFTAVVTAFDAGGANLGTFNFSGNSSQAGDGSAIFVGIKSDDPNIRKLTFDVQGSGSFAINKLETVAVPEVGSTVFGWGCAIICAARRRRRAASEPKPTE